MSSHVSCGSFQYREEWLTLCNCLTRQDVDAQPAVVQVLNVKSSTSEGGHELDIARVEQIVAFPVETSMLLLLNLKHDVACLDTWCLITLAAELDLLAALDTLVDVDVQYLAIDNSLLATALLAAVLLLDDLALSTAVVTDGLEALDHGTHLAHHGLHTLTITAGALLGSGTITTANTLALGANDGALESKLGDLAAVDVLEGDLVGVVDCPSLGGTTLTAHATAEHATHTAKTTAATEELSKEIFGSHTTAAASATLETGLTILIVDRTLLGIGENLVCVGDFLELALSGRVVCVLIYARRELVLNSEQVQYQLLTRVVFEGTNLVGLLQLGLSGRGSDLGRLVRKLATMHVMAAYPKGVIVLGFFDHGDGCVRSDQNA